MRLLAGKRPRTTRSCAATPTSAACRSGSRGGRHAVFHQYASPAQPPSGGERFRVAERASQPPTRSSRRSSSQPLIPQTIGKVSSVATMKTRVSMRDKDRARTSTDSGDHPYSIESSRASAATVPKLGSTPTACDRCGTDSQVS